MTVNTQDAHESVALQYVRGKLNPSQYWAKTLPTYFFKEACRDSPDLVERLRNVIDSGFWRLEQLDRDDPFWDGTNRLATAAKLHEFSWYEMDRNSNAVDAAWLDSSYAWPDRNIGALTELAQQLDVSSHVIQAMSHLSFNGETQAQWIAEAQLALSDRTFKFRADNNP